MTRRSSAAAAFCLFAALSLACAGEGSSHSPPGALEFGYADTGSCTVTASTLSFHGSGSADGYSYLGCAGKSAVIAQEVGASNASAAIEFDAYQNGSFAGGSGELVVTLSGGKATAKYQTKSGKTVTFDGVRVTHFAQQMTSATTGTLVAEFDLDGLTTSAEGEVWYASGHVSAAATGILDVPPPSGGSGSCSDNGASCATDPAVTAWKTQCGNNPVSQAPCYCASAATYDCFLRHGCYKEAGAATNMTQADLEAGRAKDAGVAATLGTQCF